MSIEDTVQYSSPQGPPPHRDAATIASAERELGAFLSAVRRKFGAEAAHRAGGYWIEALEAADSPGRQPAHRWTSITIAAASRLAKSLRETTQPTYQNT